MLFAQNFDFLVLQSGLSNYRLAKELRSTQTTIANWRNGTTTPTASNMEVISDFFHISIEDLTKNDLRNMESFSLNSEKEKSPTIESGALMGESKKELIQLCLSMSDSEADMVYKLVAVALEGIRNAGNG